MRIFISGGCKNGKSYHAERLAVNQALRPLYYIATMRALDDDDRARIVRHQNERAGKGFITLQQSRSISQILTNCDCRGSFLIDSLTALLASEMFTAGGKVDRQAGNKIIEEIQLIIERIENIVLVSDYIYSDTLSYDLLSEAYRKALAAIDRCVAGLCDTVLEVSYSQLTVHKGYGEWDAHN
ncbi:MAG: bifunctional adenosylcobinamide kinase/adenosylcobinamide-phosphate guanylyltransferase [Dehalococcoidia bacterium]|nr:bifunctional adenosylcobinamide kinase/adenosylcobinamide-phosphate guanylyltransferase [Dehalococcoidia bacterium]